MRRNHRKRDETKRVKEAVGVERRRGARGGEEQTRVGRVEESTASGGRPRETEKNEGHEGWAIFLKNIPQTAVAREGDETRRDATR